MDPSLVVHGGVFIADRDSFYIGTLFSPFAPNLDIHGLISPHNIIATAA